MAGSIGGKIYIVGGTPGADVVSLTEVYDPSVWSFWEPNPKSSVTRQAPAVQAVNGIIYSIGGWYNGGPVSDVTTFNPATGVWGPNPPWTCGPHLRCLGGLERKDRHQRGR